MTRGTDEHTAKPRTSSGQPKPWKAEELLEQQGVLVGGALDVGGDAPVVEQVGVGEHGWPGRPSVVEGVETDDGLGVADVDGQQMHADTLGQRPDRSAIR